MSILVNTLPQKLFPIKTVTLQEIIKILPERLSFPINVWLGGEIARYGQTTKSLIFLVEQDGEVSRNLRMYFEKMLFPYKASASSSWKDEKITALRIYDLGKLIIDKKTLTYKKIPSPTVCPPIILVEEVLKFLPPEIPFKETVYLTGSLVKNGWSGNDVDFMVDTKDGIVHSEIWRFFKELLELKVDVGNSEMPNKAPVYKYKLYEDGKLCRH